MKVKIAHIIDHLGQGGSQELLQEMIRLGNHEYFDFVVASVFTEENSEDRVSVIAASHTPVVMLSRRGMPVRSFGFLGGVRFLFDLSLFVFQFPWLLWKFIHFIKREHIDVIHAHFLFAYPIAVCAGLITRKPVTFTIPALKSQMDSYSRFIFPLYRICVPFTTHFFTALPEDRPEVKLHINSKKISSFLGVIDGNSLYKGTREENPITKEFQLDGTFVLLSVGRFEPEKGHDMVLRAFTLLKKDMPSARLVILGEGRLRSEYEAYIRENDISDSVFLPGFRSDAHYFYSRADVFVRAFLYEGMNTSLQWALAYGKAIVAFENYSPSELLDDHVSGLMIPMGDSTLCKEALALLLKDGQLREALQRGARNVFEEKLDIRRSIEIFENMYSNIVHCSDV